MENLFLEQKRNKQKNREAAISSEQELSHLFKEKEKNLQVIETSTYAAETYWKTPAMLIDGMQRIYNYVFH